MFLRIKYERQRHGLTQAALAARSGMRPHTVAFIESGRMNPTPDELNALGRALRINPARVLLKEVTVCDPEEVAPTLEGVEP